MSKCQVMLIPHFEYLKSRHYSFRRYPEETFRRYLYPGFPPHTKTGQSYSAIIHTV